MNPGYLLGKDFPLDQAKAHEAVRKVAGRLGIPSEELCHGAYRIANSNMARAIHAVSSERGRDPRKFTLLVFGGAGALHGVEVARDLGMKRVVIAPNGGVFCAYGMLCADVERYYVQPFNCTLDMGSVRGMKDIFGAMTSDALISAKEWGFDAAEVRIARYADLRYVQQSSELTIELPQGEIGAQTTDALGLSFHAEHLGTFGHSFPSSAIEFNALRITAGICTDKPPVTARFIPQGIAGKPIGRRQNTPFARAAGAQGAPSERNAPCKRAGYFGKEAGFIETDVLAPGMIGHEAVCGPVFIDSYDTTVVVPPGCGVRASAGGSLLIEIH